MTDHGMPTAAVVVAVANDVDCAAEMIYLKPLSVLNNIFVCIQLSLNNPAKSYGPVFLITSATCCCYRCFDH